MLRIYLLGNFEQASILLMLGATLFINHFVPQKLAFLSLYFLPIILGGFYLGKRKAMLGAVLSILYTLVYVLQSPESFLTERTGVDVYIHVGAWAGFLILAGSVVGSLQEKLRDEIAAGHRLNETLIEREADLEALNTSLKGYSENLESKVRERTEELELSKRAAEALKSKVEETLYSTMDPSVVNMIVEDRQLNERRRIGVMFCDLPGFAQYSDEHAPEIVLNDLNKYFTDMEPVLQAYHGHIDHFMGDGIMAEFGAPFEYDNYRLLSALAAVKMQERAVRKSHPWLARIGIASGPTLVGLIGSTRQTYTAIGSAVAMAKRLQGACSPGKVLIDRETYDGISDCIVAWKKRDVPAVEKNPERELQLEELHRQLHENPSSLEILYAIGDVHMELGEPDVALRYFTMAVEANPNSTKFRVARDEAATQLRDGNPNHGTDRVEAYEIIGIRDPLENRDKIPLKLYPQLKKALGLIQIPEDLLLPIEALDGCIGHSKVVAALSFELSQAFPMSDRERQDLVNAAFVADVGKDVVPHHLLNRRGRLTAGEFEMMRNHPLEGAKLLRKMGYQNEAIFNIVLHSHESMNGKGYPAGLTGDDVPLGSRIIAVADAYDALTSRRPYRNALDRQSALVEIHAGVEKGVFDPRVTEALFKLLGA